MKPIMQPGKPRNPRPNRAGMFKTVIGYRGEAFDVEVWYDEAAGAVCLQVAGCGWVEKMKSKLDKMVDRKIPEPRRDAAESG